MKSELDRHDTNLEYFLASSPFGMATFDGDLRYVEANHSLEQMLGVRPGELAGRSLYEVNPLAAPLLEPILRETLDEGRAVVSRELEVVDPDDQKRHAQVEVTTFPMIEHRTGLDLVALIVVDIEERKRAERMAERHRQEMIQADKLISLGTLVSGVAHEINNPNHFIMLNAPLLRDVWRDALPMLEERAARDPDLRLANLPWEEMRVEIPELIEEILRGAERIRNIVGELRAYSRVHDPRRGERVRLNDVVASALRMLANPIKKATERFEVAYGEGLPDVFGNPGRLEQVVVNLILNACQALTDTESAIEVRTGYDRDAGRVFVAVRDEGCGIADEDRTHIMDPFFTTKRERGGTGLGLAVSARIAEEHDARLEFDSAAGRGTTATLALPAMEEEAV
jgi:polar amino acid transport system substrate-binding protein